MEEQLDIRGFELRSTKVAEFERFEAAVSVFVEELLGIAETSLYILAVTALQIDVCCC